MQTDLPQNQAGPSNTGTSRYIVHTTDVLQDMRVNVSEEGSDKIIWYKERFLGDDEIVENVVHNATSTVQWSIHRPLRGWYIRIRSPAFPPGVFIPLTPVSSSSTLHTEAAMTFHTRTNIPTPPRLHVVPQTLSSQITQFLLAAHSSQPVEQPETSSFFARALSVLRSSQPSHSNSFTLRACPPPPYASMVSIAAPHQSSISILEPQSHIHIPLLVFHDRTPMLTVRSLTGLIEIDKAERD
ncbi:hypothetical protein BJ912DRAFT_948651 [Pholiota molesta]|nr:hypothetical protein BJ912DRAFT_948651 [Pholiota molesta]